MTGRAEQDAICFVAAESERVLHTFRGSSYSDPDLIWRPELELETRMLGVDDTVSSKSITGDARGRWGRPVVPLPEIRDRAAAGGAHAEHKSRAEQSGAQRSRAERSGAEPSRWHIQLFLTAWHSESQQQPKMQGPRPQPLVHTQNSAPKQPTSTKTRQSVWQGLCFPDPSFHPPPGLQSLVPIFIATSAEAKLHARECGDTGTSRGRSHHTKRHHQYSKCQCWRRQKKITEALKSKHGAFPPMVAA